MKENLNYSEILRHENEITKLKIQAEFGFELQGDRQISPAIENIWLNQILEYERALAESKQVTVAELIGNPLCKPVAEIAENDLPDELQSVMEMLHKKNIVIDSQFGVSDRELYRFITEELFLFETNSNMPKNMILGFIYEEFHPNHEKEILSHSKEFVESFCDKDDEHFDRFLVPASEEVDEIISANLKRKLSLFRDAFDKIRVEEFKIDQLEIVGEKATVNFSFNISVLPPGSKTMQVISGNGRFSLKQEIDYWWIERIEMPGVAN